MLIVSCLFVNCFILIIGGVFCVVIILNGKVVMVWFIILSGLLVGVLKIGWIIFIFFLVNWFKNLD